MFSVSTVLRCLLHQDAGSAWFSELDVDSSRQSHTQTPYVITVCCCQFFEL